MLSLSLSLSLYHREMICACVREENMIQKFTDCRVVYCIIILARARTHHLIGISCGPNNWCVCSMFLFRAPTDRWAPSTISCITAVSVLEER